MYRNLNNRFIAIVILLLFLFGFLAYFTYIKTVRGDKIAVQIAIFPSDTKTTVNGKTIKPGTHYFAPGTYEFRASKPGFQDYSVAHTINKDQNVVAVSLFPVSDRAKKWVKEHEEEYYKVFGLGQKHASQMGKQFNELNPIAKHLPYRTFIYTIGYMNDSSDPSGNSIILTIHARDGYRLAALYKIRELGYDPTDFNIVFKDYENPFPL